LAQDREGAENRDRNGNTPMPRSYRPKSVPEPQESNLSSREDIQEQLAVETRLEPPSNSRPPSLPGDVQRFVDALLQGHANRFKRRPKAFKKRVLALVGQRLPPYPKPAGRPQQPWITKAAEMYADQRREIKRGGRKRVNWSPIATACIQGFRKIRSEYKRRAELDKLRDAVYRRGWRQ